LRNNFCSGKAICITYSEDVCVALRTQHAMRMRHTVICCPVPLYNIFPTLSHKPNEFRSKVTEHKLCDLIFSTSFVCNVSHSKKYLAIQYHKCTQLFTVKYHLVWSDFNETLILSGNFQNKCSHNKFHGNSYIWSRVFLCSWTDGKTDKFDEANSSLLQCSEGD